MHISTPSDFAIPAACSKKEFIRIVKEIVLEGAVSSMRIADAALYALTAWDSEGLELMCSATGFKDFTLVKAARVSREFPPSKRVNGYTFNHYRRMLPFDREWSLEFLKRNAGKNLSSRDIYSLAVAEVGEPSRKKQPRKRAVRIRQELYARLRPHSDNDKVYMLIEKVLTEWLRTQPDVPTPVTVTPEPKRPTYAERRQAQLDAGAPPILAKGKRGPVKLRIAWTECSPNQFIDSENGAVQYKRASLSATKFWSEADAIEAEHKHFEARGYHELIKKCDVCSGGARRECWHVYHIYGPSRTS